MNRNGGSSKGQGNSAGKGGGGSRSLGQGNAGRSSNRLNIVAQRYTAPAPPRTAVASSTSDRGVCYLTPGGTAVCKTSDGAMARMTPRGTVTVKSTSGGTVAQASSRRGVAQATASSSGYGGGSSRGAFAQASPRTTATGTWSATSRGDGYNVFEAEGSKTVYNNGSVVQQGFQAQHFDRAGEERANHMWNYDYYHD